MEKALMSPDQKPSRKRLMWVGVGGLTLAALLVANGLAARTRHEKAVAAWTETAAMPLVSVFQPQQNVHGDSLRLPAHLEAWSKAPIHARVSGYLKDWKTDIGTQVKAGQILGEIDSPDLDQQVAQTHARLIQEQANARLAETTATRWQNLLATHSVSRQKPMKNCPTPPLPRLTPKRRPPITRGSRRWKTTRPFARRSPGPSPRETPTSAS